MKSTQPPRLLVLMRVDLLFAVECAHVLRLLF
nr:MAG TPA: hypothetical protein [Bacteriophage sp.]